MLTYFEIMVLLHKRVFALHFPLEPIIVSTMFFDKTTYWTKVLIHRYSRRTFGDEVLPSHGAWIIEANSGLASITQAP